MIRGPRVGQMTPYGRALSVHKIARGVWGVTTDGDYIDSAIKLDWDRNRLVHELWRSREGWYGGLTGWSIVAVTFPKHFDPAGVRTAHTRLLHDPITTKVYRFVIRESQAAYAMEMGRRLPGALCSLCQAVPAWRCPVTECPKQRMVH